MTDNQLKVSHDFHGHILALASLALVFYGKLVNWDQNELLNKTMLALLSSGKLHLFAVLNQSAALEHGINQLASLDEDEGKERFMAIVVDTVGALLQEVGGITGFEQMERAFAESTKKQAMQALHGNDMQMRSVDSFTTQAFTGDAPASQEVLDAIAKGKAVMIDAEGDIERQLENAPVPEEVKSALKAIGETVKREKSKLEANDDTSKAEELRKQGRLN